MQNLVASAGAEVFSPDRIVEVIGRGLDVCDCLKFIRVMYPPHSWRRLPEPLVAGGVECAGTVSWTACLDH